MKFIVNKNLYLVMMAVAVLIAFNFILGLHLIFNEKRLGTLDPQTLVSQVVGQKAKELVTLYPKGNVPQDKLQELLDHLRQEIEIFSREKNLILFAKGAVLGGKVPDYTQTLLERLKEEE